MNKYLISPNDSDRFENLFLVDALNEDEALAKFADFYALQDEFFIDHIHEKCVNLGLAEKFWLKTKEEKMHFLENGEILISEDIFKKRIYKYFGKEKKFANLFIEYYFSNFEDVVHYKFPDQMIKFLWIKCVDWFDTKIVNLNDIKVIL